MSRLREAAVSLLPQKYRTKLRNSIHPAQRAALARKLSKDDLDLGKLSVIIPILNAAEYIAECLTSVISQSYTNLEIIVVAHDSMDSSVKIAEGFAKYDKRISIVKVPLEKFSQDSARNLGIVAAKGDYLTIVDADDVVAAGAYGLMMRAITKSGSDFVVGAMVQCVGTFRPLVDHSSQISTRDCFGVVLDEAPDMLDDISLGNKVFQRVFWDKQISPIPEEFLQGTQLTAVRAFVRAKSFDVLKKPVYFAVKRHHGSSNSPVGLLHTELRDQIRLAHRITLLLASEASQSVLEEWLIRLLGTTLMPHLEHVPYADERYWSLLHQGSVNVSEFLESNVSDLPGLMSKVDPHARVLLRLAAAGTKDELERVIIDRMETGTGFGVVFRDGSFYAVPNYAPWLGGHARLESLECHPAVLTFASEVEVRGWTENRDLLLSGYGYLTGFHSHSHVSLDVSWCAHEDQDVWKNLKTEPAMDCTIDARSNDPFASHRESAFLTQIPAESLGTAEFGKSLRIRVALRIEEQEFGSTHSVQLNSRAGSTPSTVPRVCNFAVLQEPEGFHIDVDWLGQSPAQAVFLATQQNRIDPDRIIVLANNTIRYEFDLAQVYWGRSVSAPRSGAYTLRYQSKVSSSVQNAGRVLNAAEKLSYKLPINQLLKHAHVQAWTTNTGHFAVTLAAPLGTEERGKYWQRELQRVFESNESQPSSHIVFESFSGKSCTDSPLAISDELFRVSPTQEIYWSILDYSVSYPTYATPIIKGTREWFAKVQSARMLVNNNNFPFYFRKKPWQYYIQTWHGTPLKKIGMDAPRQNISPAYRQLIMRESRSWDLLLSQNKMSSDAFLKAFEYAGEIFTQGYPRNDDLTGVASTRQRECSRAILGISDKQIVVLYAPTWRDDAKSIQGDHRWIGFLDWKTATKKLGNDYVFLMRAHHNVANTTIFEHAKNVVDVSMYPEINDLILASDILITDYSSLMFDYMATKKRMMFLAPDVEHYENSTRGFYLDYASIAAMRMFDSTEAVLAALASSASPEEEKLNQNLRADFVPFAHRPVSPFVVARMLCELGGGQNETEESGC